MVYKLHLNKSIFNALKVNSSGADGRETRDHEDPD